MPLFTASTPAISALILAAKKDDGDPIIGVIFMLIMIIIAVVSSIAQQKKQADNTRPWANKGSRQRRNDEILDDGGWERIDGDQVVPPAGHPLAPPPPTRRGWEQVPPPPPAPYQTTPAPPAAPVSRFDRVPESEAVDFDPWANGGALAQPLAQLEDAPKRKKKRRKAAEASDEKQQLPHLAQTKISGDFAEPAFHDELGDDFGEPVKRGRKAGRAGKAGKGVSIGDVAGLTGNDLARAIVLTEIFGPPLSERERSMQNPDDERNLPFNIHRMI